MNEKLRTKTKKEYNYFSRIVIIWLCGIVIYKAENELRNLENRKGRGSERNRAEQKDQRQFMEKR